MENTLDHKCYCCKSDYQLTDKFCGKCGYPFHASSEEQKQFSINYTLNGYGKEVAGDRVKEARVVLFVIAIFTFISALILNAQEHNGLLLGINLFLAFIYAGMGFWAGYKPFAAIFTGTLIYLSIIILAAVVDPSTIFQGIIFKVIFIVALVKASYSASKFR